MSSRRLLRRLGAAALCVSFACARPPSVTPAHGSAPLDAHLVGRLSTGARGGLRPSAVVLERVDVGDAPPALVVEQRAGRFEPDFALLAVGQSVRFVNRDQIFQAAFSYSPPNRFECRPRGPGETCTITFRSPGLVRTYSPLDAGARATLVVVPVTRFASPDSLGVFRFDGVPAGRWRASVWTEGRAVATRELTLGAGATAREDFALDAKPAAR